MRKKVILNVRIIFYYSKHLLPNLNLNVKRVNQSVVFSNSKKNTSIDL